MTRMAHVSITFPVADDDALGADLHRYFDGKAAGFVPDGERPPVTTVTMATTWNRTVRLVWRGSGASAKLIEDAVNRVDELTSRAGGEYASTDWEIESVGYTGSPEVLRTFARCIVDAYDGRHTLGIGDALVSTTTGWTVERADQ